MFDFAKLDTRTASETGVPFTLRNPSSGAPILDDAKNPVTITVAGRNSDRFRAAQREAQQRRADAAARNITFSPDDLANENFSYLVSVTLGWSFDTLDGAPFPFTPENVRKLWADGRWGWVNIAVLNFVFEEGNFLKN